MAELLLTDPAYREKLTQFVYHSGLIMKPVFTAAKQHPKRIVFAEGEQPQIAAGMLSNGRAAIDRIGAQVRDAQPRGFLIAARGGRRYG